MQFIWMMSHYSNSCYIIKQTFLKSVYKWYILLISYFQFLCVLRVITTCSRNSLHWSCMNSTTSLFTDIYDWYHLLCYTVSRHNILFQQNARALPSVASLLFKWVSLLDPQSETFCIPQSTFTLEASTSACVLVFLYDCLHPDPEGKKIKNKKIKNNPSGRLFPPCAGITVVKCKGNA